MSVTILKLYTEFIDQLEKKRSLHEKCNQGKYNIISLVVLKCFEQSLRNLNQQVISYTDAAHKDSNNLGGNVK